jgi:hypothetical protein
MFAEGKIMKKRDQNNYMKPQKSKNAIFDGQKIRRVWDGEKELWYFSVVDVVRALSNHPAYPRIFFII